MQDDEFDFYPLDPQVQNKLKQLRLWDRDQCLAELKEILPNFFHEYELPEIFEIVNKQSERELKSALVQILQNINPQKIYKPSNFN